MGKGKIIVVHLAVFLILISILFITSELILNKFASGIHNVGLWMELTIVGTAGIFILTTISCLIFLKQKIIIGLIIILINLFWIWFNLDLIYRYHFTEFHPTFYIPNWILIMNLIFAIAGSIIGLMLIRKRIGVKRALLIDFLLILLGLLIQLNFV